MDEGVVEGREDVRYSEDQLTVPHLGQRCPGDRQESGSPTGVNYTSLLGLLGPNYWANWPL